MITQLPVERPREQIQAFCIRHYIRKLLVFGSILTKRFRADSDIDVLVEFEVVKGPGYFRFAGMELELSELLGRKVDLATKRRTSARPDVAVVSCQPLWPLGHPCG